MQGRNRHTDVENRPEGTLKKRVGPKLSEQHCVRQRAGELLC